MTKKTTKSTPAPGAEPGLVRSTAQIVNEIARLKELKRLVPPTTMFGDDNIARINAQILTLEDRMTEDSDLAETFLHVGLEDDEGPDDAACDIEENARDAARWLTEDSKAAPSDDWELLANHAGPGAVTLPTFSKTAKKPVLSKAAKRRNKLASTPGVGMSPPKAKKQGRK